MKHSARGAWAIAAALLLAVPAQAAGLTETTAQPIASSITTLSPAALASLQTAASAQPQPGTATTPEGHSFFKTKKGAAALVLIGAGFGYALYSQQHDRVLSVIRQ